MKSLHIIVRGIVQGVGFRPFVYKLAVKNNLCGNVNNTSRGVFINIEGRKENVDNFLKVLKESPPKLSRIDEVIVEKKEEAEYKDFEIISSKKIDDAITLISPDIATCSDCMNEVLSCPESLRYKYEFANCTNCGPRFTIIKSLPYDRKKTTMESFKMCSECEGEYYNPLNRRFHAEPTCCRECGPKVQIFDREGKASETEYVMRKTRKLLKEGMIIAVKGIGGFNLVCDAENVEAIERLRMRKHRKRKPLAVMAGSIDDAERYLKISSEERKVLLSNKRPITILKRKNDMLPRSLSYDSGDIGVLLPYSPLHYLLFDDALRMLVFTSGNLSGGCIYYTNDEAVKNLSGIADYFLVHNRDINMNIDDSVTKVVLNKELIIRKGRGYAPEYYKSDNDRCILALGSELKNTFAVNVKNYIYLSPHIGDLGSVDVQDNFIRQLNHIKGIYNIQPEVIAYDMHPNYWTSYYVKGIEGKKIGIFHHHAHIASCMAENKLGNEKVIGIAFDGTGYGEDGKLWGSEFLICDYKEFYRAGHLDYMILPAGDTGTRNPWYMAVSLIFIAFNKNSDETARHIPECIRDKKYNIILEMISNRFNLVETSSMGRLFDAVAGMLGFTSSIDYEGEAAVFLESLADEYRSSYAECDEYNVDIKKESSGYIIKPERMIIGILQDIESNIDKEKIALKFHKSIVNTSVKLALFLRNDFKINKVVLSGGVFLNNIILEKLYKGLIDKGFEVFTHSRVPCNDGGISLGQFYIASYKLKE